MLLNHWLRLLRRNFRRTSSRTLRRSLRAHQTARSAEVLEDRTLLSTFYVDQPADFVITNDQGAAGLDAGDEVTWRSGEPEEQTGLIYGTDAFGLIQDALTATTGSPDPTDTVIVADGTYNEDLVVAKAGVTLRSTNGAGATTIDLVDDVGIEVQGTANNFTLGGGLNQGFTINSGTATTFLVELTDVPADVVISHNTLDLTDGGAHTAAATAALRGVSIADGATRLTIDSNVFFAGEDDSAIFSSQSLVDLEVTNNNFMVDVGMGPGVGQQASGAAVYLYGVTASVPANPSLIHDNTIAGYATGLLIASGTGTADLRISENTLSSGSNGMHFIDGVLSGVAGSFGTVEIWRNSVSGYIQGVWVDSGPNVATGTFDVRNNWITSNDVGLTFNAAAGNATVFENDLSGNTTFSIDNNDTAALDASGNWWGAALPETDVTADMDGLIDYSPWLNSGMDADSMTAGFQGDFSTIHVSTGGEHTGLVGRLQEGVDLVAVNGTVLIHAGTYLESVTINKSLTFQGQTGTATDVNIEPGTGMDGITVTADNVTVREVRVRNWTRHGIYAANVADLTLSNVYSVSNGEDGVHGVDLGGTTTISGGQYTGNGDDGLHLDGNNLANTQLVLDANVNASMNDDDGLVAQEFPGDGATTGVSITGGTFNDNDANTAPGTAGGDGIDLTTVGAITLVNVTATGNDPGITVAGAASFSDTDGNYSNNDDHGILLTDIAGDVTLVRTVADNNDADDDGIGDGLRAVANANPEAIGGNVLVQGARFRDTDLFTEHQEHGVYIESLAATSTVVFEDSAGVVQSVEVTGNETAGVVIADGGTTARFTNGTYSANNADGLNLASFSGTVTLDGITAENNAGDGIFINGAGGLDLDNVAANSNGNDGLDAANVSGTIDVDGGSFNNNGLETSGNGFSLDGSFGSLAIDGGTYNANLGGSGIVIAGNGNGTATLTGVTAIQNDADGLNASSLNSLTVSTGSFNANDDDGIDAATIGTLTVHNNSTANLNGNHGIEATGIADAIFANITADVNGGDGLHLDGIGNLTVTNVTAEQNGNDGLEATNVTGTVDVDGGSFSMNGQLGAGNGFSLDGSFSSLMIDGGTYNANTGGSGAVLVGNGNNVATLTDLDVQDNDIDGLNVSSMASVMVSDGTYNKNTDDGIDATNIGILTVRQNATASFNFNNGIEADGIGTLIVNDLTANENSNDGLQARNVSTVVSISSSTFNDNDRNNFPGSNGGDGIDLTNVGTVTLTNVTATGNDPGITVNGAASFVDTDGNYSNNDDHGILLTDIAGDVVLLRTVADNNDADNDGVGDGFRAVDGADADSVAIGGDLVVLGARFRDTGGTTTHQQHGVYVESLAPTSTVVFHNSTGVVQSVEVTGNETAGVVIADGGDFAIVDGGSYSNNSGDGLRLQSFSGSVVLTGLTANSNLTNGIAIDGANVVSLDTVTANNNAADGIYLNALAALAVTSVTAVQNYDDGLDARNVSDAVSVDGGHFSNNGRDGSGNGFSLQGTFDAASFQNGNFEANLGGSGLRIIGDGNNTTALTGVTADGNGVDGLQAAMLDTLSVSGTFHNNGIHGIEGDGIGTMVVGTPNASTIATRNGTNGIDADQVGVLLVQNATAGENDNDGLHVLNTGAVTIVDSSFNDNDFENGGNGDGIELQVVGDVMLSGNHALRNNRGLSVANATSVSDTDGEYSANNDSGVLLFDVFAGVVLTRTTADNNDADLDGNGDGVHAILIRDTFTINGGSFRDTDGAGSGAQQQFGLRLANVANVNFFNNTQVTGNRQVGARLYDVGSGTGGSIDGAVFADNAGHGLHFTNVNHTAVTNSTIVHNGGHGLLIEAGPLSRPFLPNLPTAIGNRISQNVFYGNAGLGIDLKGGADLGNGVTLNDKGSAATADSDEGPNRLQNTPEIMYAFVQRDSAGLATGLTIVYHVPTPTSAANYGSGMRVEFFLSDFLPNGSAMNAGDVDGREGAALIATDIYQAAEALTPKTKTFARSQLSAGVLSVLDRADVRGFETPVRIVATATDADGNTSEFSRAGVINPQPGIEPIAHQPGKLDPTELPARHYLDPLAATGFFFRPGPVNPHPDEIPDFKFHWDTRGDQRPTGVLPTFFNNEFGIYSVDTANGQVNGVAPSFNSTYAQQALDPSNITILRQKMGTAHVPGTSGGYFDVSIDVLDRVGFYLIRNSTSANLLSNVPIDGSMQPNPTNAAPGSLFEDLALAFFSFANANPDSSSTLGPKHHIRTELVKADDMASANPDDGDFTGKLIIYWEDSYAPNNSGFGSSDFDQGYRDGEDAIITLYDPFVKPLVTSEDPPPPEVTPSFAASAAPVLTAPTANSPIGTTFDTTPTFTWTAVPGAARYDVWVNDLTTGQSGVIRNPSVMGTSFTPTTPLTAGHRYIWTVHGIDAAGNGGAWATHAVFSIQTPAEVTLLGPKDVAPAVASTFEWTAVSGAVRYDIWVNDQTTGQSGVIRNANVTGTMFTPASPLAGGHRYIWTVQGVDASGAGLGWAQHATFTARAGLTRQDILNTPAMPEILGPTNTSDGILPTFQWTAAPGAARYDLWVNDLTTGQSGVIRDPNISGTSYTPTTPLVAGHRYIWTVRAIASAGMGGEWAPHETFTATLSVPTLLAPAATTNSTAPTFQWTAVAGAVRYDLWVNDLTTGQYAVIRNQNIVGASYTASGLTAGHRYIWTLRAIASNGSASDWASHRTFTVAANADSESTEEPESFEILESDEALDQEVVHAQGEGDEGSTETDHRAALHRVMSSWNAIDWWNPATKEETAAG